MQEVFDYIEEHWKDALEDLIRLCQQPSVSAQGIGVEEMARLTAEMLQEANFSTQILPVPGGGYPVVYGEISGDSPATIMFYNHYDVQPPDPLEEWSSPPFEPTITDGGIRARGVADNKGNIAARLAAVKAFQAVRGSLPASVKLFIDLPVVVI